MSAILPWLHKTWQQLTAYKIHNLVPSGMLLSGPSGLGKFLLAKEYGQFILCQKSIESACGQCRACVLFKAGNHPDFFVIQPEEKSDTIKIEQIRNLIETLVQTSVMGGTQVVIISLAEQMNKAASNALLKTLEEPRGHVFILLLSNQPSSVSATILSRCQHIKLHAPQAAAAKQWLSMQIDSQEIAQTCLSMADNLPLKALEYAKAGKHELRDTLLTYLSQVQDGTLDPSAAAAQCLTFQAERLQFLMTLTADMIRMKFSTKGFMNHHDKIASLSTLCRDLSARQLFAFLDNILEATMLIANRNNVNSQLLMEKIFINWRYNYDIS